MAHGHENAQKEYTAGTTVPLLQNTTVSQGRLEILWESDDFTSAANAIPEVESTGIGYASFMKKKLSQGPKIANAATYYMLLVGTVHGMLQ